MIRALALLLLVANALFATWLAVRPAGPAAVPQAPPLAASPLVLLDELPAAPAQPPLTELPEPVPEPVATLDADGGCQALGPFTDRDAAREAAAALVDTGLPARLRAVDASERLGFWVHTPPAADRAAAERLIARLRDAGIRDFYVVADGAERDAVSLGVFRELASAEGHAARMETLGFEVRVAERRRELTAWWLDFPLPASGSAGAAQVVSLVLDGDDALVLQPRACE